MNKKLLSNAILTVVGTTFAVTAFAYPLWNAEQAFLRTPVPATVHDMSQPEHRQVVDDATIDDSTSVFAVDEEAEEIVLAEEPKAVVTYEEPAVVEAWKVTDPVAVIRAKARQLGFDAAKDTFTLLSKQADQAKILVVHEDKEYIVTLDYASGGWWKTHTAWEIIDNAPQTGKIVTGSIKIDMTKMKDLQKIVNLGYQTWRLNPLKVAKYQASMYGFDPQADTFTLLRQNAKGKHSGTGEADVLVKHKNTEYIMHLVQPLGGGEDMIWTVKNINKAQSGGEPSTPAPAAKTLYNNALLDKWTWSRGAMPQNMAFTAIVDYDVQRKTDQRFRNDIWDIIAGYDHEANILLLAYMGTMPTGGYDIGIRKVSAKGQEVTVQVNVKSPPSGGAVIQAETYPFDVVLIPKSKLNLDKKVTFKFVDESGKVLSTVATTVK